MHANSAFAFIYYISRFFYLLFKYYLRTILTVDGFDKINSQPIIPYDHNYEDAIDFSIKLAG